MPHRDSPAAWPSIVFETILLALLFAAMVWSFPPDVNEAHYLVKAKHFWDRDFCPGDLFASSHETHLVFYATHGWLCRWLDFSSVAWIGRVAAWLVTGWGLAALIRACGETGWRILLLAPAIVAANLYLNLAGEWLAGGVEAKCYAWGFGFAGLARWLDGQPRRSWIFLGAACAFHILVGLWLVIAISAAALLQHFRRGPPQTAGQPPASRSPVSRFATLAAIGAAGGLFALGFWPAITRNLGQSPSVIVEASRIQALSRLAHHQMAVHFDRWAGFIPLALVWVILAHANRDRKAIRIAKLNRVTTFSLLIALSGVLLSLFSGRVGNGVLSDLSTRLLTLYLFRLADVLVPLAAVLNAWLFIRRLPPALSLHRIAVFATIGVVGWTIGVNAVTNYRDPRSGSARQSEKFPAGPAAQKRTLEAERNWIRTCHWIRNQTPPAAIFITPEFQQTFKWHAGRGEVANWKDMPQDAASVVEWHARRELLYRDEMAIPPSWREPLNLEEKPPAEYLEAFGPLAFRGDLQKIAAWLDADYLVVEQRVVDHFQVYFDIPPGFQQVYPPAGQRKSTFVVYRLR